MVIASAHMHGHIWPHTHDGYARMLQQILTKEKKTVAWGDASLETLLPCSDQPHDCLSFSSTR